MREQFIDKLVCSPWNIDKLRGRNIIGHMVSALLRSERPAESRSGDPLPKMQVLGDVAVIPVRGVLMMAVPDWVKAWGFRITDANDIEQELDQALASPEVRFLVIDCDSPGGSSLAGNKLFDLVEAAGRKKPVFGWCGDGCDMASACYDSVASAQALLAGRYAIGVGCIGSYLAYLDDTGYWEQLGLRFHVFRSGELKGIGEDALSEPQAAYLQSLVDKAGAQIRKNVLKYRTGIAEEDLQGQWFTGLEAAQRGFVAGTAKDISAAIAKFRKMV